MTYYDYNFSRNVSCLLGLTLTKVELNSDKDEIIFEADNGQSFIMLHVQDCCEHVSVDDITGDLADLVGHGPVLIAEEASNETEPPQGEYPDDSFTWTFYKIGTVWGTVTIRWYGSSNGYYSEGVDFYETTTKGVE
jgi:hypothetical protein